MKKLFLLAIAMLAFAIPKSNAQVGFDLNISSGPRYYAYPPAVYRAPVRYYRAPKRVVYVEQYDHRPVRVAPHRGYYRDNDRHGKKRYKHYYKHHKKHHKSRYYRNRHND